MLTVSYPVSLLSSSSFNHSSFLISLSSSNCNFQLPKKPNSAFMPSFPSSKSFIHSQNYSIWRATQLGFCFQNGVSQDFTDTQFDKSPQSGRIHDTEELELLDKPSPKPTNIESASEVEHVTSKPDKDEALAPFLRFFNSRDAEDEQTKGDEKGFKRVVVEYYEPEPGDFVVGVVVSGNENKLDVNIGADLLGTMLTKEVLPLYDKEMDFLLCDVDKNAEEFLGNGKLGIIQNEDALSGQLVPGRPVVDVGTVLFAEVLGRTLSGRPLLSTRRFFKRIAWHRVRQIKQLDEPIEVRITEWNTGGLLTRIEGLRAFLPKAELMNRVNNFADLKENVGRHIYVQIIRLNEADNDLILSEREAWEKRYLQEGTLLEGTVRKIFLFGAQVRLGQTNRSGLLHISNISRGKVTSVSDLLTVGEKVKVLVITSLFPDKISLSTADLESEPGLLISNKEKVFEEAEVMAKKYRQKLPAISAPRKSEPPLSKPLQFDDETSLYANWKWFKFQREDGSEGQ